MRPEALVQALRGVPSKRLRLVELAWELVREDGTLDVEEAALRMDEVELAIQEAEAYIELTRRVLWHLKELAR